MSKQSPTVDSSSDRNYKHGHYYDDVELFKEVVFQNDSEDDFTDGKRLTSLVRESYVKRLRDLLKQNYQVWYGSCENVNNSENINLSPTDIEKCVKFLEQKALRSCMIAALYQKSMIQLLSDIKHKTKDYKLFDNLNKIEKLNLFTSDKYVQTDQKLSEKQHVETQTINEVLDSTNKKQVRSTTSLLDLPLPNPRDVLLSLGSNFIDKNNLDFMQNNSLFKTPSANNSNETIAKVQPQPRKPQSKVSSNNILLHNEGFVPESKRRKISNDLNYHSNVLDKNNLNDLINNLDVIVQTESNLNNKLQTESISNVVTEINSNINETIDDNLVSLDDRLAELGLFVDDESNNSSNKSSAKNTTSRTSTLKGRRSSWFIEMTAHYCNFIKIFLTLNENDRVKVKGKFKKLFGTIEEEEEHNSVELTENNLTICRKRTANMVVYELTPYYETKRILSRHLFKEFAKRVTDSIMERTYAADSKAVNQFITEYFNEHEYVRSLDDFEF